MLIISIVCAIFAAMILMICCVFAKGKTLPLLLGIAYVVACALVGLASASFNQNFSLFVILLLSSIIPQLATAFNLKAFLQKRSENSEENNAKNAKNGSFWSNSNGTLIISIANLLSAILLAVCAFVLGKETFVSVCVAPLVGISATLFALLKKKTNPFDLLSTFLSFSSVGLMLSQILIVLIYSTSISSILFCLGILIFAIYAVLSVSKASKYAKIAYFLSIMCLFGCLFVI